MLKYKTFNKQNWHEFDSWVDEVLTLSIQSGKAIAKRGNVEIELGTQAEINIFSKERDILKPITDDFVAVAFTHAKADLETAINRLGYLWVDWFDAHWYYIHTPDSRSQKTWVINQQWMSLASMLFPYESTVNLGNIMSESFLLSFWTWAIGTVQIRMEIDSKIRRSLEIYKDFCVLVREDNGTHRQIQYYADKLCVSRRYLTKAVSENSAGKSPKQIVDNEVMRKVIATLRNTSMTFTQVAEMFEFSSLSSFLRWLKNVSGLNARDFVDEHVKLRE